MAGYQFGFTVPTGPLINSIVVTGSASYTPTATDVYVIGTGTMTFNLPAASSSTGRVFHLIAQGLGLTVQPNGTDQVNGGGAGVSEAVGANTWASYIVVGTNWVKWNQF